MNTAQKRDLLGRPQETSILEICMCCSTLKEGELMGVLAGTDQWDFIEALRVYSGVWLQACSKEVCQSNSGRLSLTFKH